MRDLHVSSFLISLTLSENVRMHEISNPPCTRSAEYRRLPVTVATTLPPLNKNKEQIRDIFFSVGVLLLFLPSSVQPRTCPFRCLFLANIPTFLLQLHPIHVGRHGNREHNYSHSISSPLSILTKFSHVRTLGTLTAIDCACPFIFEVSFFPGLLKP